MKKTLLSLFIGSFCFAQVFETVPVLQNEVQAQERRFAIYPNTAANEFYIKGKQNFSKNVNGALYDASGKLIPVKSDLKDSETLYVDINNLPSGVYTLNVTQDKELLISQKIIKE
ncbi:MULTISPECIES: T9SS type A sorting domain-containing protein [Chryseobacterium]|uniref:Secretion system C-terminal sorting domain-containing protein n=1 Tax=Chryseobacterium geocarposphaerae TaxID=1416776 RepID=A0ABU1LG79_9FLAO|nr:MULTISPECIES: T9SS type A sorting domain-containing protein [Chryseobacterium]MDR6405732.1 hypothetical protein [Chryseobacterium geocarposphaerae]MDR6699106.1 hypothetical protein [Chryseobacterium ginsenosidimutans]